MSDSLKDQLLGLGFKPAPKPARGERREAGGRRDARPVARGDAGRDGRKPRTQDEIDLAKAYALRAETEKREREAAERARQEAARLRREQRARLEAFLAGKALNDPAAEQVRHFPYGGKIKRVHVTPEQLKALNAGELGVVQSNGRYLLVSAAVLAEAKAIFADAIALEVDPNAPVLEVDPEAAAAGDGYADPRYRVPDDLVW